LHANYQAHTPLKTSHNASVFAEMLVFHRLKEEETRREGRMVLVAEKLEDIMATVFRQAVLTRFEQSLHSERRDQGELTTARISELWIEANREMFGDSVTLTENYAYWWLYIPHFIHSPFYCYAYSFGELLTLALYGMFLERGKSFVPGYMELLRSGGSASPAELLSGVGVDINNPGFWQTGLDVIGAMVDEVEELAEQSGLD
ncbi:MAG: M3 family metallopeptidase, partial [Candidatus Dadabacteria bacterium]|nr:M3 family metallopeptidase [Candidatus Dadabacteria bacterium]